MNYKFALLSSNNKFMIVCLTNNKKRSRFRETNSLDPVKKFIRKITSTLSYKNERPFEDGNLIKVKKYLEVFLTYLVVT